MSTKMLVQRPFLSLGLTFALLLGVVLFQTVGNQAQAQQAQAVEAAGACRYEKAVGVPSWVTTGSWQEDKLLVVDVTQRRLTQISNTGVASELRSATNEYLQAFNPTRIREGRPVAKGGQNFLVEVAGGGLVEVDRSLRPRHKPGLATVTAGLSSGGGNKIAMLIDWVWAGDQILGYADIQGPGNGRNSWKNGFVRFDADQPTSFSITRERMFPDSARVSMTLTYPLLASIKTTGYVALVDGQMDLWEFRPGDGELRPMHVFPKELYGKPAPLLPSWIQKEEYPDVMAAVERESMPAGLWAWDDSLFLLFRTFEHDRTHWFLSKIDPVGRELLWTVPVPGSANHMTVIPGPDEWAFLEKGPVNGWLNQETNHIRFVKSSQLARPSLQTLCR